MVREEDREKLGLRCPHVQAPLVPRMREAAFDGRGLRILSCIDLDIPFPSSHNPQVAPRLFSSCFGCSLHLAQPSYAKIPPAKTSKKAINQGCFLLTGSLSRHWHQIQFFSFLRPSRACYFCLSVFNVPLTHSAT